MKNHEDNDDDVTVMVKRCEEGEDDDDARTKKSSRVLVVEAWMGDFVTRLRDQACIAITSKLKSCSVFSLVPDFPTIALAAPPHPLNLTPASITKCCVNAPTPRPHAKHRIAASLQGEPKAAASAASSL